MTPWFLGRDLLELKWYDGDAPTIYLPLAKCLSALAYADYFPDRRRLGTGLRTLVSGAVLAASPGWCGTWGPHADGLFSLSSEGNYDMSEMHLLSMVYRYYDALAPEARERLITLLLARGRIHRPNCDDTFTSGPPPDDWTRAGFISPLGAHKDIGETENHILMIATARYLTNQLLFQRDHKIEHDNRRNGSDDWPSCTALLLFLLRNMLRDDFSEYNAKTYQEETRQALLNLCSYSYDHEVRLAAHMVLDYISAHIVVSSSDLRRMVPFRRRNEGDNVAHDSLGAMTVDLLPGGKGQDPMGPYFALQAGNTRAFESSGPWPWGMKGDGTHLALEALSTYRLPVLLHDLFVNDSHRRFFQRLHRTVRSDEPGGNRNADNMEIYAASPSYLISAGGAPSGYAIDPHFAGRVWTDQDQELGVAVTTSFMPTGFGTNASDLIQFGAFSAGEQIVFNYGVAPDFACGHNPHLPRWVQDAGDKVGRFLFVNHSWEPHRGDGPGFYLAIYQEENLGLLEAFDTWLHPDVTYEEFVRGVLGRNSGLALSSSQPFTYSTANGNRLAGTIWDHLEEFAAFGVQAFGAQVTVEYGDGDPTDRIGDAGNTTNRFLNGTVLNSPAEGVVELTNPFLGTKITLDMSDLWHPRRVAENGVVDVAGANHEVWLDFDWHGPSEGDVCRPFSNLAAAVDAVAPGGVVKIVPSTTTERLRISTRKPLRLVAPIGGVVIGARDKSERIPTAGEATPTDPVRQNDVWVQFDFYATHGNVGDHSTISTKPWTQSPMATSSESSQAKPSTGRRSAERESDSHSGLPLAASSSAPIWCASRHKKSGSTSTIKERSATAHRASHSRPSPRHRRSRERRHSHGRPWANERPESDQQQQANPTSCAIGRRNNRRQALTSFVRSRHSAVTRDVIANEPRVLVEKRMLPRRRC